MFKELIKSIALLLPDSVYLRILFFKKHKCILNLKNPKSLNEKIQWLKLHERTSLHTLCADKYLVRDYIKKNIGEQYLIPLIYQTENIDDVTLDVLPNEPCIIKTNHLSGYVYILKSKDEFNVIDFKSKFSKVLKDNYYYPGREWQYKNIQPRIIIEKLLTDNNGEIPKDYKFHCFNNKIEFIQVDSNRFTNHTRNLYDINWKLLPFNWSPGNSNSPRYKNGKIEPPPSDFEEMKSIVNILSKPFRYVRIDLYSVLNKIYFGEITFHQDSGTAPFYPREYDIIYGEKLKLPQ